MNSVLLTVDLTRAVATEAIENKHCCVVAYHPIIFRGLKSLTLADPQQSSLLRLALEGISVYCPHTAVDAVPGGMADWLCDIVTGSLKEPHPEQNEKVAEATTEQEEDSKSKSEANLDPNSHKDAAQVRPGMHRSYSRPTYPSNAAPKSKAPPVDPSDLSHTRIVIHQSSEQSISQTDDPSTFSPSTTGAGRLITFKQPQPLAHLIERIAHGVGTPKGFPVAIPQERNIEDISIRTVGVCPGSGGSVLNDCNADLIFTGELSHHDALAVTERGGSVLTLFHSNSERGYLRAVMRGKLESQLKDQWETVRQEYSNGEHLSESAGGAPGAAKLVGEDLEDALADESVNVEVSEVDRDPFGLVVLQGSEVEGLKL